MTTGAPWRGSGSAGSVAAAVAAILFGTAFVATAVQLRSFDPLPGAFWRALTGGAGLLALLLVTSRTHSPADSRSFDDSSPLAPSKVGRIVVLGLLSGPIFLAGFNVAVGALGATIGGFVVGLYAVLAAVLGPIVARDRLGRWALVGFLAALLGTALLSELRLDRLPAEGIGAGLVAAVSYALYIVLGRRWSAAHGLKPELVALSGAGSTVVLLLGWIMMTAPRTIVPATVPPEVLLAVIWLGVVLVAGQTLVMTSVKRVTAQRSAAFLLLNPLTSAVLAAGLLGERLTPSQFGGALLVLLGIAAATRAWQVIPTLAPADAEAYRSRMDLSRRSVQPAAGCAHMPAASPEPLADRCQECGSDFNLRLCGTCGHVGCCESQLGHAREHALGLGHPVIYQMPAPNGFVWCYEERAYVG